MAVNARPLLKKVSLPRLPDPTIHSLYEEKALSTDGAFSCLPCGGRTVKLSRQAALFVDDSGRITCYCSTPLKEFP